MFEEPSHVAGGSGLAGRPYAPVSFLAAGRRKRTLSFRVRAPVPTARVRGAASGRPVGGGLTKCRWADLQHDPFVNHPRAQFVTHANDPNVAWYTLRSAALRLLPSVMLPRYVPYGRAWRCVSTFLSNRAKTLPVLCGKPLARLS